MSSAADRTQLVLGCRPGPAEIVRDRHTITLGNAAIAVTWLVTERSLRAVRITDRVGGTILVEPGPMFRIEGPGVAIDPNSMTLAGPPAVATLRADPTSPRLAERSAGFELSARFVGEDWVVDWRAVLRDGSGAVEQFVSIDSGGRHRVQRVVLWDCTLPDARIAGTVDGSPAVSESVFVAAAHPLARCSVRGVGPTVKVTASVPFDVDFEPGVHRQLGSVIGVARPGQLRRGFLHYLERARAHPARPFLHYNTWYDIGFQSQYDEATAVATVEHFASELVGRGARVDGFALDDGWDDPDQLWQPHVGFPRGLAGVASAAANAGAGLGVWLSPWGGYGDAKLRRLAAGRARDFETTSAGFALSGERYYAWFCAACSGFLERCGVRYFKLDGLGSARERAPGSRFGSDFDAAIELVAELRRQQPEVFVNLTVGTWASPFWLLHADSIWRGGDDRGFAGEGSPRQRWITYRDAIVHEHVVRAGPLFPLSALMLHGIVLARHADELAADDGDDLDDEIRSYFASGVMLQELYISPHLMSASRWDALATAARWARQRTHVLCDVAWLGGDPRAGQVYGWAAWAPGQAVIAVRNPTPAPQALDLELARALALPPEQPRSWRLTRALSRQPHTDAVVDAHAPHTLDLSPFEVAVFDATPP